MPRPVPTPKVYKIKDEDGVKIKSSVYSFVPVWDAYVDVFKDMYKKAHGITLGVEEGGIELYEDSSLAKGSYRIETDDKVCVYASDNEGILYALASVLQLPYSDGTIARLHIEDYADKEHRALMIDLAREWHTFDKLLKYVDVCFVSKIKYLQLHFADTQRYTLPSKAFPKLSSEGECYSFEEIDILNEYAKERGIVIIPEYEGPGHAKRFNQAYPEVFSDKDDMGVEIEKFECVDDTLICAGSEVAFEANKALIKEIANMFPDSPYIHIGGDEANFKRWDNCSICRKYMKEKGIADVKELYCDYIARLTEYIISLGKTPMVWEGFPKSGTDRIPKETIVVSWDASYQTPGELLSAGFKIINASWKPLYIVPGSHPKFRAWGINEIYDWNVYNWQNVFDSSKATLNPITIQPTDNMLGSMLCAWEGNYESEITRVVECVTTMAERVWNVDKKFDRMGFYPGHENIMRIIFRVIQDR